MMQEVQLRNHQFDQLTQAEAYSHYCCHCSVRSRNLLGPAVTPTPPGQSVTFTCSFGGIEGVMRSQRQKFDV